MGASKKDSKGSKNIGVVIALFVALFIIGSGAAYLIVSHGNSESEEESQNPLGGEKQGEEKVVETKSLVEEPPPLPEETPKLAVTDAAVEEEEEPKGRSPGKRYIPTTGTIDPKAARSYIKSHSNKVRNCYEKELKVNHLLQGKVTTKIIINPDGNVAGVQFLADTVGSPKLKACIRKEISSWRFPKPQGGRAEVQFPFRFQPKQ